MADHLIAGWMDEVIIKKPKDIKNSWLSDWGSDCYSLIWQNKTLHNDYLD